MFPFDEVIMTNIANAVSNGHVGLQKAGQVAESLGIVYEETASSFQNYFLIIKHPQTSERFIFCIPLSVKDGWSNN